MIDPDGETEDRPVTASYLPRTIYEIVASALAFEVDDDSPDVDHDLVRAVHAGEIEPFVGAVIGTGVLEEQTAAACREEWSARPWSLMLVLLHGRGDATVRRYRSAWSALA